MQRTFRGLILSAAAACLVMPAIAAPGAQAAEKPQEWELVNPAGIIEKASVDPAKRIARRQDDRLALEQQAQRRRGAEPSGRAAGEEVPQRHDRQDL